MLKREETKKSLDAFNAYIVQQSRSILTKTDSNVSKELYNSIKGTVMVNPNSIEVSFEMAEYGLYQDQGVQGSVSNLKAPNSPFKFGTGTGRKGGLTSGINQWVKAKGFQFRNRKSGKFMSFDDTADLITRSVYQKGMKPKNFFSKPFEKAFEILPDDIVEAFGLDVENFLKTTLENGKRN